MQCKKRGTPIFRGPLTSLDPLEYVRQLKTKGYSYCCFFGPGTGVRPLNFSTQQYPSHTGLIPSPLFPNGLGILGRSPGKFLDVFPRICLHILNCKVVWFFHLCTCGRSLPEFAACLGAYFPCHTLLRLVTPNFHHWHHSQDAEAIDKNYAANFAFLD